MKLLRNRKGEGYIDVAVTVMVVAFVLVFAVHIVSFAALNQNMKTAADQLVEYAAVNGSIEVSDYAHELRERMGVDFDYSFDGSVTLGGDGKVQLGERIQCTVTCRGSMLGFGDVIRPFRIRASATGLSRVYWK